MGDIVINKQGLIFLTLTSLILVLSVYYVTMPNELLLTTNSLYDNTPNSEEEVANTTYNSEVVITNSSTIEAMKSLKEDERQKLMQELNNKLIDKTISTEEKNSVYEEIKNLNKIETMESEIEAKIKKEFGYNSFVKIKDDVIEITINSEKHDTNLAVKIMTSVEKDYKNMYISVSFKA